MKNTLFSESPSYILKLCQVWWKSFLWIYRYFDLYKGGKSDVIQLFSRFHLSPLKCLYFDFRWTKWSEIFSHISHNIGKYTGKVSSNYLYVSYFFFALKVIFFIFFKMWIRHYGSRDHLETIYFQFFFYFCKLLCIM